MRKVLLFSHVVVSENGFIVFNLVIFLFLVGWFGLFVYLFKFFSASGPELGKRCFNTSGG